MIAPVTKQEYPAEAPDWTSSDFDHVTVLSVDFLIVRWFLPVFEAGLEK